MSTPRISIIPAIEEPLHIQLAGRAGRKQWREFWRRDGRPCGRRNRFGVRLLTLAVAMFAFALACSKNVALSLFGDF